MELLVEVLAAAGETCLGVGKWFYPGDTQSAVKMAVGCLTVFVGMSLIAIVGLLLFFVLT
jgi:hypothetical protein